MTRYHTKSVFLRQELLRIDLDCDRDSLKFVVHQNGTGFCHLNTRHVG